MPLPSLQVTSSLTLNTSRDQDGSFLLKASALQLWSLCFGSSRCILCDQTCQDQQVQQQRPRCHTYDESVIAGSTIAFSTKCEDGNQASGLKLLPVPDQDADDPVDAPDHRTLLYGVYGHCIRPYYTVHVISLSRTVDVQEEA